MITPKDLFKEFMVLGYYPGTRKSGLKDIPLQNYAIARITRDGWNIISFYNGTNIYIPWELVDLFESFNTWGGHKVLISEPFDEIDKTILGLFELNLYLIRNQGVNFLNMLSKLCSKGTAEFRDWFEKEFEKTLPPIEISTLDNLRTI